MAKSKIIKDLANGTVDTATALKRVKVLLSEIKDDRIEQWLDAELSGYPDNIELPDYRVTHGNLEGSYFKGSMSCRMTLDNVSIPLGEMPEDIRDNLLEVPFNKGVSALRQMAESVHSNNLQFGKNISADYFPMIAHYNKDPYMNIVSARVVVSPQCIENIFSVVENKLLDILLILEKEFGNLDDLDIEVSSKTPEQLTELTKQVYIIIFNDNSVKIGDANKISHSDIASIIEN